MSCHDQDANRDPSVYVQRDNNYWNEVQLNKKKDKTT